jgi:CHAT domain-containing protein
MLRGPDASEEVFRRFASQQRVLHLATYGVLNTHNPLFSFIDLAPGAGHDGRLDVHEVFGLDLAAELVVLSACQTALGSGALADIPRGDDWVGLTRAFLHAGAARVVATLWAVEDQSMAEAMEHFYERRAAGADDVTALAQAQRGLLAERATAHPFHWAGVVLVGEQRGMNAR